MGSETTPSVGEPGYLPYCCGCSTMRRMSRGSSAFVCKVCGLETRMVNGEDMFDRTAPSTSATENTTMTADNQVTLEPCLKCGAVVSVQIFTGPSIIGEARVLMCSNHALLHGNCPSEFAALNDEAWNQKNRHSCPEVPLVDPAALKSAERMAARMGGSFTLNAPSADEAVGADIELLDAQMVLENKATLATSLLSDTAYRPTRAHIEGARNGMNRALDGIKNARAALAAMDSEPGVVWLLVEAAAALNVATDGQEALRPQRTAVLDALRAFEQAQPAPRPVEAGEVTQVSADVAELVIAARELVFSDHRPVGSPETQAEVELIEMFDSLDKATEAFSERIPWHDEPETETRHRQQSLSAARAEIEALRETVGLICKRSNRDWVVVKDDPAAAIDVIHTLAVDAYYNKAANLSTDQGREWE